MFLLFYLSKKKILKEKPTQEISTKKEPREDLESLKKIVKNKETTSKELQSTLDLILKDYPQIQDFDIYMDILITICIHPNTTTKIVINFNKKLSKLNPKYKSEISNAVTKGLNARG